MKAILINPPRFGNLKVIREDRCEITERDSVLPPMSLIQMAAYLRNQGHEIKVLDANGFDQGPEEVVSWIERNSDAKVLISRFTPTTIKNDTFLFSSAKRINNHIITIGICWTTRTQGKKVLESIPNLDIYVTGDTIDGVCEAIDAIENHRAIRNGANLLAFRDHYDLMISQENHRHITIEEIGIPAYDLLPSIEPYYANTRYRAPYTVIYSSKGCPFRCSYCTVAGTNVDLRSAESVMAEIDFLVAKYGLRSFTFFDETFTLNRDRAFEICSTLRERSYNLSWFCNTRSDLIDQDLLRIMHESGCEGISLGIESGNQTILDLCQKGTSVESNASAIRAAKRIGLRVFASFIVGLPGETKDTIEDTIRFIKNTRPNGIEVNIAVPYPGTRLFESFSKENPELLLIDWNTLQQDSPSCSLCGLPLSFLSDMRIRLYKSLYLNPMYFIENAVSILSSPSQTPLALRFILKTMRNLFFFSMKGAH